MQHKKNHSVKYLLRTSCLTLGCALCGQQPLNLNVLEMLYLPLSWFSLVSSLSFLFSSSFYPVLNHLILRQNLMAWDYCHIYSKGWICKQRILDDGNKITKKVHFCINVHIQCHKTTNLNTKPQNTLNSGHFTLNNWIETLETNTK